MRFTGRVTAVLGAALASLGACASGGGADDDGDDRHDAAIGDGRPPGDGAAGDAATTDARVIDAVVVDAAVDAATDAAIDARPPIISGGPCLSGTPGATAYRIRWVNAGGSAQVQYEVNGLPDHSRDHAGAYGYQIGFTPQFVDIPLGGGGLLLNGSSFVDLELSTAGLSSIANATLALYGRSYNTTTSGSFNWQTFDGLGATPSSSISNSTPYRWYPGDMTTEISPGDNGVLIRIKAGPASGSLSVARIELCMVAT